MEGEDGVFVIRKSSLTDNSPPSNIITSALRPADLSVDSVTKTLYWMTEMGDVCSSDYNGDSTVCFQCCNGETLAGIAVFEVFVYLSLRESNSVVQIQRDLGMSASVCVCLPWYSCVCVWGVRTLACVNVCLLLIKLSFFGLINFIEEASFSTMHSY